MQIICLLWRWLIAPIIEANVEDLPAPVTPVIKTKPLSNIAIRSN